MERRSVSNENRTLSTGKVILAVILGLVVLLIAQAGAMILGNLPVMLGLPVAVGNVMAGIFYPIIAFGGVIALCRGVLKISLRSCKLKRFSLEWKWVLAAVAMPCMVVLVLVLTGGNWEMSDITLADRCAVITGAVFFYGMGTGIVEEMIFRGVIMSALESRFGKMIAIVVPSVLFGAVHIIGTDMSIGSMLQLLIAGSMVGMLFSIVCYVTGSIWCSALMHGVWNLVMVGGILHIGESADDTAMINYVLNTRSFLLTGGDFGVEASVISVLAYLIVMAFAARELYQLEQKRY